MMCCHINNEYEKIRVETSSQNITVAPSHHHRTTETESQFDQFSTINQIKTMALSAIQYLFLHSLFGLQH